MHSHWIGLGLSTGTLVLWSISPFFFAAAGRRVGPYTVNLLRLAFALPPLGAVWAAHAFFQGGAAPGLVPCVWLILSGGLGLALGDFFLYRCFVQEGPERTSQLMT